LPNRSLPTIESLMESEDAQSSTKAVGFILHRNQYATRLQRKSWNYLMTLDDLRVIHLTRSNLLDRYVSEVRLRHNKQWNSGNPRLYISPDELLSEFRTIRQQEEYARRWFDGLAAFEINYENHLLNNFETALYSIQDFLGLALEELTPQKEKLNYKPHHELIINYEELRRYFRMTEWSEHFNYRYEALQ